MESQKGAAVEQCDRIRDKVRELLDVTGGTGPEWHTVEWILDEIIKDRPVRYVDARSRERAYLDLLARVQGSPRRAPHL